MSSRGIAKVCVNRNRLPFARWPFVSMSCVAAGWEGNHARVVIGFDSEEHRSVEGRLKDHGDTHRKWRFQSE